MAVFSHFKDVDWLVYGGAEKFSNGADPFIFNESVDGGLVTVVADRFGIQMDFNIDGDDEILTFTKAFPKPLREIQARAEIKALYQICSSPIDLTDLMLMLMHPDQKSCFYGFTQIGD